MLEKIVRAAGWQKDDRQKKVFKQNRRSIKGVGKSVGKSLGPCHLSALPLRPHTRLPFQPHSLAGQRPARSIRLGVSCTRVVVRIPHWKQPHRGRGSKWDCAPRQQEVKRKRDTIDDTFSTSCHVFRMFQCCCTKSPIWCGLFFTPPAASPSGHSMPTDQPISHPPAASG